METNSRENEPSQCPKAKEVGVGKRGSILISQELVESLGIGAEDKCTVRKTKAGIALKFDNSRFVDRV